LAHIDYTDFIRTSQKRHKDAVHHLWVSMPLIIVFLNTCYWFIVL